MIDIKKSKQRINLKTYTKALDIYISLFTDT